MYITYYTYISTCTFKPGIVKNRSAELPGSPGASGGDTGVELQPLGLSGSTSGVLKEVCGARQGFSEGCMEGSPRVSVGVYTM